MTLPSKGVILSAAASNAHENLMEQARLVVQGRHTTLNAAFREGLEQPAAQSGGGAAADARTRRLRRVRSSDPYTRNDE